VPYAYHAHQRALISLFGISAVSGHVEFLTVRFPAFPSVSVLLIEAEVRLLSFSLLLYFTDMVVSLSFS
jgi:hypothetical protein